jgi:hypothetical protein
MGKQLWKLVNGKFVRAEDIDNDIDNNNKPVPKKEKQVIAIESDYDDELMISKREEDDKENQINRKRKFETKAPELSVSTVAVGKEETTTTTTKPKKKKKTLYYCNRTTDDAALKKYPVKPYIIFSTNEQLQLEINRLNNVSRTHGQIMASKKSPEKTKAMIERWERLIAKTKENTELIQDMQTLTDTELENTILYFIEYKIKWEISLEWLQQMVKLSNRRFKLCTRCNRMYVVARRKSCVYCYKSFRKPISKPRINLRLNKFLDEEAADTDEE